MHVHLFPHFTAANQIWPPFLFPQFSCRCSVEFLMQVDVRTGLGKLVQNVEGTLRGHLSILLSFNPYEEWFVCLEITCSLKPVIIQNPSQKINFNASVVASSKKGLLFFPPSSHLPSISKFLILKQAGGEGAISGNSDGKWKTRESIQCSFVLFFIQL